MSRFGSIAAAGVLAAVGVFLTPASAPAQFGGGYGSGYNIGYGAMVPLPSAVTPFVPFTTRAYGFTVNPGMGLPSISYSRSYSTYGRSPAMNAFLYSRSYPGYSYPTYSGGYMSGSAGGYRNPATASYSSDYARSQRDAAGTYGSAGARGQIYETWAYDKLGVAGLTELAGGKNQPDALKKALAVTNEAEVSGGEALNHILVGIVAVESKGAKGPSAFLPPNLLAEVRFAGSPAADALNLFRSAGNLKFPAAFDEVDSLRASKEELEKGFAAVSGPVLVGKSPDSVRVGALNAAVQKAHAALTPAIKDLTFEDATAARRFLNQLESAGKLLKDPNGATGLVNPKWGTDGTTVADLVKHMTKFKLLFGPAPGGSEEAYLALHRGLAAYLFALAPPKK